MIGWMHGKVGSVGSFGILYHAAGRGSYCVVRICAGAAGIARSNTQADGGCCMMCSVLLREGSGLHAMRLIGACGAAKSEIGFIFINLFPFVLRFSIF